jgi:hypothetical protein
LVRKKTRTTRFCKEEENLQGRGVLEGFLARLPKEEPQDSVRKKRTCKEEGPWKGLLGKEEKKSPAKEEKNPREGRRGETAARKGKIEKFLYQRHEGREKRREKKREEEERLA